MKMIERPLYMNKLNTWKDRQMVKILTGVRRCGKSTLFKMFQDQLRASGVSDDRIITLNMEDPSNLKLLDWHKLYDYIDSRLVKGQKNYVFIDEVQTVKDFQRAADGLFINEDVDLYLTGSNSHFQSGEWATMLTGRYIEIHVLPLSFKEYVSAYPFTATKEAMYKSYLNTTGFPYTLTMVGSDQTFDMEAIQNYISSIYTTIVLKDVVENKKIRDVSRMERVLRFTGDQVGKLTSIKRISDVLKSDGIDVRPQTIENYIDAFLDGYLLYRAKRWDVKGANILRTQDKYYFVDPGFLRLMLDKTDISDRGHILENVVYLELLRRGYKVFVGKLDSVSNGQRSSKEIDFVAMKNNRIEYYQVAETTNTPETMKREFTPLNMIRDHNPKFVLSMDEYPVSEYNGILQINVFDWLLKD